MPQVDPVEFSVIQPFALPPDYPKSGDGLNRVYVLGAQEGGRWSMEAVEFLASKDEPQPVFGRIATAAACSPEAAFRTGVAWLEGSEVTDLLPLREDLTHRYPPRLRAGLMFSRFLLKLASPLENSVAA